MKPVAQLIPHRPPWALVDRLLSVDGGRVTALKQVTANDPLGALGLGGPLLIEALAQTAACLVGVSNENRLGHRGYLVAARGWKFPSSAAVGETITLVAEKTSELGNLHGFQGSAKVADRLLAEGSMTFAVSFDEPAHG